jgi:hypothetical protein
MYRPAQPARPDDQVSTHLNAAATLSALPWMAAGLLAGGLVCLIAGVLIVVPLQRPS